MKLISQAINHWDTRVGTKAFYGGLLKGTNHDDVGHSRNDLSSIFNGFTTTKLGVSCVHINRMATQLMDTGLK